MTALLRELRYAAGSLTNSPGLSAVVAAVPTLGVGASTALFSLVEGRPSEGLEIGVMEVIQ